jgi:hypothetical protein
MAKTSDDIVNDVASGMYATRHGLNSEHLRELWCSLGKQLGCALTARKVGATHPVLRCHGKLSEMQSS